MCRHRLAVVMSLVVVFACSREKGKDGKSPTLELIGDVAAEVREKPRIQLLVKLAGESPTDEEKTLLRSLEESVEREGIGRITGSGSQPGYLFLVVEADNNSADAIARLRAIALSAGVLKRSSFRVIASGS